MLEIMPFFGTYFAVVAFLFGTIVGSFLNVVIYRLHTGRSLSGSSHCLSCQHDLSWYELIPLISYIALRGRCMECSSYIPSRYFVVELMTGLGFLAIFLAGGSYILMFLTALLYVLLLIIAVYDIYHFVIPNDLVLFVSAIVAATLGYALYEGATMESLLYDLLAGTGASAFFWLLWKVSGGRWIGFGDVKLAFPLGVLAGSAGVFSMVVLSFWIGAVTSVFILSLPYLANTWNSLLHKAETALTTTNEKQNEYIRSFCSSAVVAKYHRYFTIKSEVPFAPFLIAGFVLTYFYGVDVLALVGYVLS